MRWFLISLAILGGMGYMWYAYRNVATGALGLELREILVPGQNRTSNTSIFWALNMVKGNHMWKQPLDQIHKRLETLPWVKSASVQRCLPWTFILTLVEKTPMAIWQNEGKKCVIDKDGHPIAQARADQFPGLIVITGAKAPEHFYKLLNQMEKIPELPRIKGASFLRSQRWDLYLEGGVRVQLPQEHRSKALMRLAQFWPFVKNHPVIDLRFPDALIFRPRP
jgi:cell division protein FtsQ